MNRLKETMDSPLKLQDVLPEGTVERQPDGSYVVVRGGNFKWNGERYIRAVKIDIQKS